MRHPLSLEAFIEWASAFPSDREYDYADTGGCIGFQFVSSRGLPIHSYGTDNWHDDISARDHKMDRRFASIVSLGPHTFGAAVLRARKAVEAGR